MGAINFPSNLGTAQVADACTSLALKFRVGPSDIRPLRSDMHCAGGVLPLRYDGAPERFFQVLDRSAGGDVLVMDNAGRLDASCMGDVMAYELRSSGLAGLVIWGAHRDTEALARMNWPIFSLGANPVAPAQDSSSMAPGTTARCGELTISSDDFVICDSDGVVFVNRNDVQQIISAAKSIVEREAALIATLEDGTSLRKQLDYDNFARLRERDPSLRFSDYIKGRSTGSRT